MAFFTPHASRRTMKVTIYSDGGSDPNPGYGGWGALLLAGKHEKSYPVTPPTQPTTAWS